MPAESCNCCLTVKRILSCRGMCLAGGKLIQPMQQWLLRSAVLTDDDNVITRSHPEMVGNMSHVTLNFDL